MTTPYQRFDELPSDDANILAQALDYWINSDILEEEKTLDILLPQFELEDQEEARVKLKGEFLRVARLKTADTLRLKSTLDLVIKNHAHREINELIGE